MMVQNQLSQVQLALQPGKFRIEMLMRHDGRTKLITSTVSGIVERSEDASADIISDLDTIPTELKFGTLKESRPLTRSLILRNVTSKTINVISLDVESNEQAGYTLKSDCDEGKYEPGAASQVGIFPEAVPGKGLLTASQTDIDFGNSIESTSAITVSLVNVGDTPLNINKIRLSNE